jgi:putative intracellular protease/amidase
MAQTRILMVLTSNGRFGMQGGETGLWLDSFATPFYAFEDAGVAAEVATIRGGAPAIDPRSRTDDAATDAVRRAEGDTRLQEGLARAPAIRQVQITAYDAIFLPGGHGAVWDFPASPELTVALEQFALKSRPIVAVGHGVAGLIPVMDRRSQPLTRGRRVAAPTLAEEKADGLDRALPFLLETKLRDLGALLDPAEPFAPKIEHDELLITGQNAASAAATAEALIAFFRKARAAA